MDILTWIFAGAFAAVLVITVYLIIAYVWPMRGTPAMVFVHAKKNAKKGQHPTVVALDDGSRWVFKAIKNQGQGVLIDDEGIPIRVTPKSLKWSMGVLFGAGEYFRSQLANTKLVDLLQKAKGKGITEEELITKIATMEKDVQEEIERLERGEPPKLTKGELDEAVENARAENAKMQEELKRLRDEENARIRKEEQRAGILDKYDGNNSTENTTPLPG